ncbi:MAG: HAD family hydrolase [Gammaproteobacteria bacterium]|nr:HAD family hydrolase [Gammaproteobacteria bacterium]
MTNSNNRFTHVIFDFDGTLFDTAPAIVFCLKKAFNEMGYDSQRIDGAIAQFFAKGIDLKAIAWQLLSEKVRNQQVIAELMKHYRALYQQTWMQYGGIFSGAEAIVKFLAQRQVKIIIVSNKGEAAIEQALAVHQLLPYVCCIIGDREGVQKKPSSDCYDRTFRTFLDKNRSFRKIG